MTKLQVHYLRTNELHPLDQFQYPLRVVQKQDAGSSLVKWKLFVSNDEVRVGECAAEFLKCGQLTVSTKFRPVVHEHAYLAIAPVELIEYCRGLESFSSRNIPVPVQPLPNLPR